MWSYETPFMDDRKGSDDNRQISPRSWCQDPEVWVCWKKRLPSPLATLNPTTWTAWPPEYNSRASLPVKRTLALSRAAILRKKFMTLCRPKWHRRQVKERAKKQTSFTANPFSFTKEFLASKCGDHLRGQCQHLSAKHPEGHAWAQAVYLISGD